MSRYKTRKERSYIEQRNATAHTTQLDWEYEPIREELRRDLWKLHLPEPQRRGRPVR